MLLGMACRKFSGRYVTAVLPAKIETPIQQGGSDCAVLALRTAGAAAAHGPDPLIWQQKSSQMKQPRVYRPGWGRDYWRTMNSARNREAIAQELIGTRLIRCDVDSDREQKSAAAWLAQEATTPQKPLSLEPGRLTYICLLYTSPSPRDGLLSRMPSSA